MRKTDVRETQGCMATSTRKRKYEEVRWSLFRSSLAVRCTGVSAFCFPIVSVLSLVAISTTHSTVHMLDMSVAWQLGSVRGHVQHISITWMGRTRSVGQSLGRSRLSVGRSVDARGPVDHDNTAIYHPTRSENGNLSINHLNTV